PYRPAPWRSIQRRRQAERGEQGGVEGGDLGDQPVDRAQHVELDGAVRVVVRGAQVAGGRGHPVRPVANRGPTPVWVYPPDRTGSKIVLDVGQVKPPDSAQGPPRWRHFTNPQQRTSHLSQSATGSDARDSLPDRPV